MRNSNRSNLSLKVQVVVGVLFLFSLYNAAAQPEVELTYLSEFDSDSPGTGLIRIPIDVDVDSQGRIWMLDALTETIKICDYNGNCDLYQNADGSVARYLEPSGLAIDNQDRVLVLERGHNRLHVCSGQSASQCQIHGEFGSGLGQFNSPFGVAVNSQGQIVIADTDNRRVQQCDYSGNCTAFGVLAGEEGGPGVWWSPFSVGTSTRRARLARGLCLRSHLPRVERPTPCSWANRCRV
jgi:hypothetical protein